MKTTKNYRKLKIFFSPFRGMGYIVAYDVTSRAIVERIRVSQYDKYDAMCEEIAKRYMDTYTISFA